ncbi:MAG: ADP-ribosylation factor-like protein [Promethearchaeota archaeon]
MEYLKEEKTSGQKILFTGLDDAGKTSIITALKREFSKIAFLKPTRGAQRRIFEFLGKEISSWDLGGQLKYRIRYLKSPDKYFDNTEMAIYVIDVQNKLRIPEAISYFNDVIEQFKNLMIEPPICVFFHKFDPSLVKSDSNELNGRITNLKERIKKFSFYEKIYFYNTSVYDFSSIMKAMSEILLAIFPKSQLIEKTIEEFSKKISSDGVIAIDDNSLIIGSYFMDEKTKTILSGCVPYFLTLNDSFKHIPIQSSDNQMIVQRFEKYFIFKQLSLREGSPPYYILLLKNISHVNQEEFKSLGNLLKEILYK